MVALDYTIYYSVLIVLNVIMLFNRIGYSHEIHACLKEVGAEYKDPHARHCQRT